MLCDVLGLDSMVPVPISLLKLNDYWKSLESGYFAWRYGNSRGPDIAFVT